MICGWLEGHTMGEQHFGRRRFLLRALHISGLGLLGGCDSISQSHWGPRVLGVAEHLTRTVQRLLTPRHALAREYTEADLSLVFPANGNTNPANPEYQAHAGAQFVHWRLEVDGLVHHPLHFSLAE